MPRHRLSLVWIALTITLELGLSTPAHANKAKSIQALIDRWLESPQLSEVTVGVSVIDLTTGENLGSHQLNRSLYLASVTKLLTTAGALNVFDRDHRWTTRVRGTTPVKGISHGPLVLVGGGDPKLLPEHLEELALNVKKTGVRHIEGDIIVDSHRHDDSNLPPAFALKPSNAGYRPAIGASASNFGAFEIQLKATAGDTRPKVTIKPQTSYVSVINQAEVKTGHHVPRLTWLALSSGRTQLTIEGYVGPKNRFKKRKRVANPNLLSAYLLRDALERIGVTINGAINEGITPKGTVELARHESATLKETVRDINTWSNNFMAETLFKEIGVNHHEAATWDGARQRLHASLHALALPSKQFELVNGSGLYLASQAQPELITTLLFRMAKHSQHGKTFIDSLAIAGETGTLEHRLRDPQTRGKVLAKSGTLDEVCSLAGYIRKNQGRDLAFAVIINDTKPSQSKSLKRSIDRLVKSLVRYEHPAPNDGR